MANLQIGKPLDGTPQFDGTVRRGSATCPVCGYTTPVACVRRQLKARRGGAADARLFCVVTTRAGGAGALLPPADRGRPGSRAQGGRRVGAAQGSAYRAVEPGAG